MSKPLETRVENIDRRKFLGLSAATAGVMLVKPEFAFGTAANSALQGCPTSPTSVVRPLRYRLSFSTW